MNTIAILPESGEEHPTTFSAITKGHKATGHTPGEALDALTSQLGAEKTGVAVVVQRFFPDKYFSAEQRDRLSELMARWRTARESGDSLPPSEQADLERLIDEELEGSTERAAQIARELKTAQRLGRRSRAGRRVWSLVVRGMGSRFARQLRKDWLRAFIMLVLFGAYAFLQTGMLSLGGDRFLLAFTLSALAVTLTVLLVLEVVVILVEITALRRTRAKLEDLKDSLADSADSAKQEKQTGAR
jgi:hypothetical protein